MTADFRKSKRARLNKLAELKPKEQLLVMETLNNGGDAMKAAEAVGLPAHAGPIMIAQPKLQNALQEQLYRRFPDIEDRIASSILEIMETPLNLKGNGGYGVKPADRLKAVAQLIEIMGFKAPQQVEKKSVSVNLTGAEAKQLWPGADLTADQISDESSNSKE